jgi:hypothetical protein
MMTIMSTPQSGDIAARQDRLAQASRLLRSAQSLAEKIAELTEDELARICDERGNMVPGAIAADSTNARTADRLTVGGVAFCYVVMRRRRPTARFPSGRTDCTTGAPQEEALGREGRIDPPAVGR